jgi:ornithine cyclodeaminase/alanine dehydrogenase-like protein (mu-crystallin family)
MIVAGKAPGRENPRERNISINLGLALDDMATAIRIYHKALELGIGAELPL